MDKVSYRVALLLNKYFNSITYISFFFNRRFKEHWVLHHLDIYREYRKGADLAAFQRRYEQQTQNQANNEVVYNVTISVTQLDVLHHITRKVINNQSFTQLTDVDLNAFDNIIAKGGIVYEKLN
jgi:hypothetical protein